MATVHKSPVLTLRCRDWSETSQVVQLLARDVGRVRCLAKGSKRGRNPFGGPVDRWTFGEAVFSLRDPNRLAVLMELYETERFDGLRRQLRAFFGASLVTELILALVPEVERQPAVFDLSVAALRLLAGVEPEACRAVSFAFAWRLLALLGYGPRMGRCAACGRPLEAGSPVNFSAVQGGAVCGRCRPQRGTRRLSARAAEAVAFLATADWDEIKRVRLSDATAGQIRAVLSDRLLELAGRELLAVKYV
ncbi:MAG TPA: DNA repair protein RecO [Phycisphaerae bacterium]|nr:DNA repair protein RecO [Phycisphaerae bacterium]